MRDEELASEFGFSEVNVIRRAERVDKIDKAIMKFIKEFVEKDRFNEEGKEIYSVYLIEIHLHLYHIPYVKVWTRVSKEMKSEYYKSKDRCYKHDRGTWAERNPSVESNWGLMNSVEFVLDIELGDTLI